MKRVAFHTLGCKLNYAETSELAKKFIANGYEVVCDNDNADIFILNTCSVTANADRECRQIIRRIVRKSPDSFIAVVGCYAQLQQNQIAKIKGVDLILGAQDKSSVFQIINNSINKKDDAYISCISNNVFEYASSAGFEERTRAFIKVQDGCDYQCSYCTVPLARGFSRSADIDIVKSQIQDAVNLGYKEVVLTGVNVGDYGRKNNSNLLSLLKEIVKIKNLERIRISSIEPNLITNELLQFWLEQEILCKHWHIPLQSGSNDILKLMRRRYSAELFLEKLEAIKTKCPNAGIGADVIVGFPGETEKHFEETYKLIENSPTTYLHVFSYSERPNTSSVNILPKINPSEIKKRSKVLHQLAIQKKIDYFRKNIGSIKKVLLESKDKEGFVSGLTEEYIHVKVKAKSEKLNQIINVKIDNVAENFCIGLKIG